MRAEKKDQWTFLCIIHSSRLILHPSSFVLHSFFVIFPIPLPLSFLWYPFPQFCFKSTDPDTRTTKPAKTTQKKTWPEQLAYDWVSSVGKQGAWLSQADYHVIATRTGINRCPLFIDQYTPSRPNPLLINQLIQEQVPHRSLVRHLMVTTTLERLMISPLMVTDVLFCVVVAFIGQLSLLPRTFLCASAPPQSRPNLWPIEPAQGIPVSSKT